MKSKNKSTVVLLSGGMDSATCLYLAKKEYSKVFTLSFDYGQRHRIELKMAKKLSQLVGANHYIIKIQSGLFQNSSLVDLNFTVPKNRKKFQSIPNTYVPGRNILFLSYAVSFAESRNSDSIFIGVNSLDYSGYPDCRPGFIEAFQEAIRQGTKNGVQGKPILIKTPLLHLTKTEIAKLGLKLGVPFEYTSSCYDPDPKYGTPCGKCDACLLRKKAFANLSHGRVEF